MKTAPTFSGTPTTSVASALALVAGAPPALIQLLAMGSNDTRNGVPPKVVVDDTAHAKAIATASMARYKGAPILIDYDHQSVFAANPSVGGRAPAAGWMTKIIGTDDGVFAQVEWNTAAALQITASEYRFISPYFTHRKDGRVISVINAGLTNTPNLDLAALASENAVSLEEDETSMDFKAIASALGLADTADEAAILAAIAANKGAISATATALGVVFASDPSVIVAAATAVKAEVTKTGVPDPAKFVPISVLNDVQASVATMRSELDTVKAERLTGMIDDASERLTPAMRAYAESLEETSLASFLGALPETSLGRKTVKGDPKPGGDTLSDEERATASMWGLSDAEFIASRKQLEAR